MSELPVNSNGENGSEPAHDGLQNKGPGEADEQRLFTGDSPEEG